LQRLGQSGGNDVGNPFAFPCDEDGLLEEIAVGTRTAHDLATQMKQRRFEKLQDVVGCAHCPAAAKSWLQDKALNILPKT